MQAPQFNFVTTRRWLVSWLDVFFCVIAIVLLGFCYAVYQVQSEQFAQLSAQIVRQPIENNRQAEQAFSTQQSLAEQAQRSLNLPWLTALAELETLKKQHVKVQFLSIEPNPNRAQIYLKVKAEAFAEIANFLEALKAGKQFGSAELTNQFAEDENMTVYEILLGWKI